MKPQDLLLRCYAERSGGQWQAFCIDLCLASQGDSFKDVKFKLDSMIKSYVYDALAGEDSEYADQLLLRKAPLYQRAKYYLIKFNYYKLIAFFTHAKNGLPKLFKESLPLVPSNYGQA